MSRDGSILLAWAGGEHLFRLTLDELEKVETACGCGIFKVAQRLSSADCHIKDMREPLLWGLKGGGMDLAAAQALLKQYFVAPFMQHRLHAQMVLMAALVGPDDEEADDRPKAEAAGATDFPSPPSTSPES